MDELATCLHPGKTLDREEMLRRKREWSRGVAKINKLRKKGQED